MKKIYISLVFLFIGLCSQGQTKLSYGIFGGFNAGLGSISSEPDLAVLPTFHFGIFGEYKLSDALSIQPSLTLNGRGASIEHKDHHDNLNIMTLDLPINVIYRYKNIFVGAGPQIGFGLSANMHGHSESGGEEEEMTIKFGNELGEFKPFQFGINLKAGYEHKSGIFGTVGYVADLTNWSNINGLTQRFNILSVGVGYRFAK